MVSTRRILILHAEYRTKGGEETVVDTECALLRRHGHTVARLGWSNNDIPVDGAVASARAAVNCVWNRSAQRKVREAIARDAPDVVHVHNTFPIASPAVILAAVDMGVPVVQTIHNFRLACVNGMLFRDGKPCEVCVGGSVLKGALYGCYRGSRAASVAVAAMIELHRAMGTWKEKVSHFLAVSERVREILIRSGIPSARITVRAHCLEADPGVGDHAGGYALIASRLSAEKGITTAIAAWRRANIGGQLVIAGDGPELEHVRALSSEHPRIRVLGRVSRPELMTLMSNARLLLVPSLWDEPAAPPLVAVEAIATGLPVLASAAGGLGEWVRSTGVGWTAPPGDVEAWADALRSINADDAEIRARGRAAREEFLRSHSASGCIKVLVETYDNACAAKERVASPIR